MYEKKLLQVCCYCYRFFDSRCQNEGDLGCFPGVRFCCFQYEFEAWVRSWACLCRRCSKRRRVLLARVKFVGWVSLCRQQSIAELWRYQAFQWKELQGREFSWVWRWSQQRRRKAPVMTKISVTLITGMPIFMSKKSKRVEDMVVAEATEISKSSWMIINVMVHATMAQGATVVRIFMIFNGFVKIGLSWSWSWNSRLSQELRLLHPFCFYFVFSLILQSGRQDCQFHTNDLMVSEGRSRCCGAGLLKCCCSDWRR